jgi:hypothetical protein
MKPKETKIGYTKYQIEYVDELTDQQDEALYGRIDLGNNLIKICKNFNLQTQKATLLHEVLHGIDNFIGTDLDENETVSLSNMLYLWMLENKETVKFLIEEDK